MKEKRKVYRYDVSKKLKRDSDDFDEEYSDELFKEDRQLKLQKLETDIFTKNNKKDRNCN